MCPAIIRAGLCNDDGCGLPTDGCGVPLSPLRSPRECFFSRHSWGQDEVPVRAIVIVEPRVRPRAYTIFAHLSTSARLFERVTWLRPNWHARSARTPSAGPIAPRAVAPTLVDSWGPLLGGKDSPLPPPPPSFFPFHGRHCSWAHVIIRLDGSRRLLPKDGSMNSHTPITRPTSTGPTCGLPWGKSTSRAALDESHGCCGFPAPRQAVVALLIYAPYVSHFNTLTAVLSAPTQSLAVPLALPRPPTSSQSEFPSTGHMERLYVGNSRRGFHF